MQSILTYPNNSDQELYCQTEVQLHQIKLKLQAGTIAGSSDKPNEDAFAAIFEDDTLFAGIFDGTTSFPIPALGKVSSARYASHFIKEQFSTMSKSLSPEGILLKINTNLWDAIKNLHGITLSDTLTLPASTATVIKIDIDKNIFSFAHVGDAFGIVYFDDGQSKVFTDDKNRRFDEKMFALIRNIAKEDKITNREARQDPQIDEALKKMYYGRNNNPEGKGSGLINGDPHLKLYIQTGEIKLTGVKTILLGTDGLLPQGWSENRKKDRQKLVEQLRDGALSACRQGFQKMFETKHKSEDEDPDWEHIRYKHSDDATGILIDF